jgi:hypothetical protein
MLACRKTVMGNGCYDPETLTMLRGVLDEVWDALPPAPDAEIGNGGTDLEARRRRRTRPRAAERAKQIRQMLDGIGP